MLDDVIVDLGFVERADMEEAIRAGRAHRLGARARPARRGQADRGPVARGVAERFGLDHLDLPHFRVDPAAAKLVTPAAVKRYQALPVSFVNDRTLLVAMADPANVLAVDDIAVMTGYEVRPAVAAAERHPVRRSSGSTTPRACSAIGLSDLEEPELAPEVAAPAPVEQAYVLYEHADQLQRGDEDASVIGLVHKVISEAVDRGASDIHFEPVRARHAASATASTACCRRPRPSRRPSSRRSSRASRSSPTSTSPSAALPQDGRISMDLEGQHIDVRVVTLPTVARRVRRHAHPGPELGR